MELGANCPDGVGRRTAIDFASLNLVGAAVNDLLPLHFGIRVHRVVQARNELAGQIRAISLRQGQHFGDFLSGYAHAAIISLFRAD